MQWVWKLSLAFAIAGSLGGLGESAIAQSLEEFTPDSDAQMGHIPSVSRLSDVRPTDWAYAALQDLIQRYDCLTGYPDGTFRGDRALTRYEFAAALNACLDRVQTLILGGNLASRDDRETLKHLQSEFETELTQLRDRVDTLEASTAVLEDHQFSTTTKLRGNVWLNFTGAYPTGNIWAERNLNAPENPYLPPERDANNRPTRVQLSESQETFSYSSDFTLTTSFTGKDSLVVELTAGNGNSPANQLVSAGFYNSWGTPFLDRTDAATPNQVVLRHIAYTFPVGDNLRVAVGPSLNYYRYFDNNPYNFFPIGTTSFNSNGSTLLSAIDRGPGAVITWQIAPPLAFTIGYLAEKNEYLPSPPFQSATTDGFFKSSNILSAELDYAPTDNLNLRFIYARSSLKPYNGYIGDAVGEPLPYGFADDGFGGTIRNSGANTFVFNFDWLMSEGIALFGRYSYGNLAINPINPIRTDGEIRVQSFQIGLGLPDLGKQGALGVISFLVPHHYLEGREFLLSGGGDGGTQYELEASYFYPISQNMAIVPALYTIWNANNFSSNPAVFVGNLRAQFHF
ncbi:iron uptake porin [Oscillatoria sp. FACHB-1406]|uniref:iron uptake porin n=1 Tax=Oscillatoria sp. FACHB-1406 TaxID=2692846 RepID=UPI0016824E8A|nr:iron uptake porin [Oscillatoria sp. FACHB-1406]MBD2577768.1 carbohydrate porin [Oscillatoria sp. FACHB-1406]